MATLQSTSMGSGRDLHVAVQQRRRHKRKERVRVEAPGLKSRCQVAATTTRRGPLLPRQPALPPPLPSLPLLPPLPPLPAMQHSILTGESVGLNRASPEGDVSWCGGRVRS